MQIFNVSFCNDPPNFFLISFPILKSKKYESGFGKSAIFFGDTCMNSEGFAIKKEKTKKQVHFCVKVYFCVKSLDLFPLVCAMCCQGGELTFCT